MKNIELKYFLLADHVIEDKQGKVSAIGIFDTVNSKNFPVSLRNSYVVAKLSVYDSGIASLDLVFSLIDSEGITIGNENNITVTLPNSNLNERSSNIIVNVQGVPFQKEGIYKFILKYKNELLGETSFRVVKLRE
jgi:hypothetical protein